MRSRIHGPAAATLAALLLVACATPAERELHKVSLASERLWTDYDACMARMEGTAAYRRLDRAFILKQDDPRSVEKMAIERLASDQEKADLLQNQKNEFRCNQELFKGFAEINPGFNVLHSRFMNEDDELVLRTIQNEITVGSRNRIVHQRFAQRLRDWNFASERLVRLHTWRLRRTCSVHCSSFSAASLLPTSTAGASNLASVTPLPPTAGQEAGLPQAASSPDAPAPTAAPAAPTAQTSAQAAAPATVIATLPAAKETAQPAEPKAAPKPTAQAPAVIPLPGAPKPTANTADTAAAGTNSAAQSERAAKTTAKPAAQTAATALTPPRPDSETGLKPAAGPDAASNAPKKQPVQVASATKTAQRPVYSVHLASMDSEVEARAEWGKLQARYPALLGDRVLFTREVTIGGKGTFVRVLTGLFHDRDQARALCGQLGGGDQYCAVLKI